MKGKVIVPFVAIIEGNSTAHRKGEVLEILDWSWVRGGLVEPLPESVSVETATLPEPEISKPIRVKKGKKDGPQA